MKRKLLMVLLSAGFAVGFCTPGLRAQETTEPPKFEMSAWDLLRASMPVGAVIIALSMAGLALTIEHLLTIRRDRFLPPDLMLQLEPLINAQQYDQARQLCDLDPSFLAKVVGAGLAQAGNMFGYYSMQSAMEETSAREIGKVSRKLEWVTVIAATAPMFGLLGTVTGMIRAFIQVAAMEGAAKPSQLAGGISEALVTTAGGLVVAIPMLFVGSFFRNRLESYVAEVEAAAERLFARFRNEGQTR